MVDVPIPEIGPDEVLIKVRATSICGTDVHIYQWDPWAAAHVATPITVGHELTGIVVDRVSEVLDIAGENIEDPPSFGTNNDTEFILGMGKVGNRVTILLDITKVLDSADISTVMATMDETE